MSKKIKLSPAVVAGTELEYAICFAGDALEFAKEFNDSWQVPTAKAWGRAILGIHASLKNCARHLSASGMQELYPSLRAAANWLNELDKRKPAALDVTALEDLDEHIAAVIERIYPAIPDEAPVVEDLDEDDFPAPTPFD